MALDITMNAGLHALEWAVVAGYVFGMAAAVGAAIVPTLPAPGKAARFAGAAMRGGS